MQINAFTATGIWNATVRSLTGMGSTTLTFPSTLQQTLAAATSVDGRAVSTTVTGEDTCAVVTGAAATGAMVIQLYDGTNAMTLAISAAAANSPAAFTVVQSHTVGLRITNNDGAVAGKYMIQGWRLTQ